MPAGPPLGRARILPGAWGVGRQLVLGVCADKLRCPGNAGEGGLVSLESPRGSGEPWGADLQRAAKSRDETLPGAPFSSQASCRIT